MTEIGNPRRVFAQKRLRINSNQTKGPMEETPACCVLFCWKPGRRFSHRRNAVALHRGGPSEAHGLARRQQPVAEPERLERRLFLRQSPRRYRRRRRRRGFSGLPLATARTGADWGCVVGLLVGSVWRIFFGGLREAGCEREGGYPTDDQTRDDSITMCRVRKREEEGRDTHMRAHTEKERACSRIVKDSRSAVSAASLSAKRDLSTACVVDARPAEKKGGIYHHISTCRNGRSPGADVLKTCYQREAVSRTE